MVLQKLHCISATRYGLDRGITSKYPWTLLHKSSRIIVFFPGLKSLKSVKMDKECNKGFFFFFLSSWQIHQCDTEHQIPLYWTASIFYSTSFSKDLMKQNITPLSWKLLTFAISSPNGASRALCLQLFPTCPIIRKRHWQLFQPFSQLSFLLEAKTCNPGSVLLWNSCKIEGYGASYF